MGLALALPGAVRAEPDWPAARPIEIIVPYPPGGGIDVMARLLARALPDHLPGARFVVTNRIGAGGQTGSEAIFAARPDGYTLGAIASLAFSSIPLERKVRWDIEAFTYLANVVNDPGALWVRADSPLRTLDDLKRSAARGAEAVSIGSAAGVGSDDHQLILAFEEAAQVRVLHSPYNGTALAIRDLLSSQLDVAAYNLSEGLALLREGRTRCLGQAAVTRWSAMAEVPTFREQGFDVVAGSARGFVAPPGLPGEIYAKLVEAFAAILASPGFVAEAERLNLPLQPETGDAFRSMVRHEAKASARCFSAAHGASDAWPAAPPDPP
ncbi:Bug family tripartite tricarboxylate transporter substrate binding protein [Roseicella frigidaeris]|nr:tripartite tricarboxylate transporter substrate binding protein [Roseicella frigidaeris]